MNYHGPKKKLDRETNAADLGYQPSVIMMPSRDCLDVDLLRTKGIIDGKTRQWWIERDPALIPHLEAHRAAHFTDRRGRSNVTIVNGLIETFDPPEPVSYVNADMMSYFTGDLGLWLERRLAPKLMPEATVVLTLLKWCRRNPLARFIEHEMFHGSLQGYADDLRLSTGTFEKYELVAKAMLAFSLPRHDFEWTNVNIYRDKKWWMMSMRIDSLRPAEPVTAISTLIDAFKAQHTPHAYHKRTPDPSSTKEATMTTDDTTKHRAPNKVPGAGKRAWETRRANAAKRLAADTVAAEVTAKVIAQATAQVASQPDAERRSERAKKAWETRRANQARKRRSESAKKAWETRRRKAEA